MQNFNLFIKLFILFSSVSLAFFNFSFGYSVSKTAKQKNLTKGVPKFISNTHAFMCVAFIAFGVLAIFWLLD